MKVSMYWPSSRELTRGCWLTFFMWCAVFLLSSNANAQITTGTISGTVLDASAAVVPNANIVLTNIATQDVRRSQSNGAGYFTFASVPPGTYKVKVELTGFKAWEISGIVVNSGDKRNVTGIALNVGSQTETVTVEASASQVAFLDSGERSSVLSSKDIQNLSLVGRDATELLRILPGINNFAGGGGVDNKNGYDATVVGIGSAVGNGYSANGSPYRGGTDLVSDGAHVLDPGCNCNATQTINADMVQEVKVQTSNFGADSAKGPVVINATGKSGTPEFHGDARFYARNAIFNSNDWNNNHSNSKRPDDRYYYPGGSIGGPVKIPGTDFNHNKKLLFFTGYEYYNQAYPFSGGLLETKVPTLSMRTGNFDLSAADNAAFCAVNPGISSCKAPMDPTRSDGTLLPGGQVTTFDPGGQAIMNMIAEPNATPTIANGGNNYINQLVQAKNGFMYHARVDYDFSDNTKIFVSYNLQKDTGEDPVMIWWTPTNSIPYPGNVQENNTSHTFSATFLKVLSPSLTNEAIFALGYGYFPYNLSNPSAVSRSKLGYPYQGIYKNGTDQMPAVWDWGGAGYPQMGMYGFVNGTLSSKKLLPSFTDNVTKVWRTHTFKLGGFWEQTGNKQINPGSYTQGQLSFVSDWSYFANTTNNHATNNSVANMLMGYAQDYQETNTIPTDNMAYNTVGFYANDDWKVNKNLTLQIGVRLDHLGTWYDKDGTGLAVWDPSRFSSDLAAAKFMPGIYWTKTDNALPTSGRTVAPIFISPRFGLAYDVFGNTKTVVRGGFGAYRWRDQYNTFAGALATSLGQSSVDAGSIQMSNIDSYTPSSSFALPNGVWAVSPHDHAQPVTYSYNLTISQATPGNSILEIAYVGNQSHFLDTSGQGPDHNLGNVNYIPLGAFFGPDPTTGIVATTPDAAGNVKDHYRPFYGNGGGFGSLYVVNHDGWANYNALQASWNRTKGWLTYGINYTWSKALGINTDANPSNLNNDYGVLNIDRSHVLNINYLIDTGTRFHGDNHFLRGVANGWQLSGIISAQSGVNLQSASSENLYLQATDISGKSLTATTQLGSTDYKFVPLATCDSGSGVGDHTYINGNCFSVNNNLQQNGDYQLPYMSGPAYISNDMTLSKTFKISERQGLQFRFAAFNVFNHPLTSFNNSDSTALTLKLVQSSDLSWKLDPNVTTAGKATQPFGVAPIKYGRRVLELALKYSF